MMKKTTTRLMTKGELESVNPKIRERFGATRVLESGSILEDDGIRCAHIVVRENQTTEPNNIKKLGDIVKETLTVDKVYYKGIQIA
jgi:hypothetical protein